VRRSALLVGRGAEFLEVVIDMVKVLQSFTKIDGTLAGSGV